MPRSGRKLLEIWRRGAAMRRRAASRRAAVRGSGFDAPLDFRFFFAYAFRRCHPKLARFYGGFMALNEALLPEFDAEMANTRKTLERVPTDKFSWKPHERSGTMGWLANHLADVPEWAVYTLQQESLDMAPNGVAPTPPPPPKTTKELLAKFDKNVAAARAWHGDNRRAIAHPRTRLLHLCIAGLCQHRAPRRYVFVKLRQQFLGGFGRWRRRRRNSVRSHVQRLLLQRVHRPLRDVRQVIREPAHRSGPLVRLPGKLVRRHALQRLARIGHFGVKLREQRFVQCHKSSIETSQLGVTTPESIGEEKAKVKRSIKPRPTNRRSPGSGPPSHCRSSPPDFQKLAPTSWHSSVATALAEDSLACHSRLLPLRKTEPHSS